MMDIQYMRDGTPWIFKNRRHHFKEVVTASVASYQRQAYWMVYITNFDTGLLDSGRECHFVYGQIFADNHWIPVVAEIPKGESRFDYEEHPHSLEFELLPGQRIPLGLLRIERN